MALQSLADRAGCVTGAGGPRVPDCERGFSLIEILAALVITVVAILGLAYSFSTGRTLIDRYAIARAALAEAQGRMEQLSLQAPGSPDLTIGTHSVVFLVNGAAAGTDRWDVEPVDDPIDGLGGADPNPIDLKRVTVNVNFGFGAVSDTVRLSRLFPVQ